MQDCVADEQRGSLSGREACLEGETGCAVDRARECCIVDRCNVCTRHAYRCDQRINSALVKDWVDYIHRTCGTNATKFARISVRGNMKSTASGILITQSSQSCRWLIDLLCLDYSVWTSL